MVIVDSSVWVDYLRDEFNPHTDWLENALGRSPIGITNLILCEVLQGIRQERRFSTASQLLLALPVFDTAGTDIAVAAARNYRLLQSRGVTVRTTIDCLIATFCLLEGFDLLHHDRDFDAFQTHLGLTVIKV
jgi:predicted nucleic acid-binding protein